MDSIYTVIDKIVDFNTQSILATVINVEGSAYRKEGASMLFMDDDRQIGVISAGCLETDLAIRAENMLKEGSVNSYIVVYDMSAEDDLSWGRGAGCNGKVHILLEKVTEKMSNQMYTLRAFLKKGQQVTSWRVLDKNTVISTSYLSDKQKFGDKDDRDPLMCQTVTKKESSQLVYNSELNKHVYIQSYHPKPRLFVFGAGPDVRPLARMAIQTGFSVTVWDWRPDYYNQINCPEVTILTHYSITQLFEKLPLHKNDFAIVMTHDFQRDREILHFLLRNEPLKYLGVLGPRNRTSRLLDGKKIPDSLHSPVGLSIGAEGPEEISISIIAHLIQTLRHH